VSRTPVEPLPLYSPLLWWRYWVRFSASFVPPSFAKAFLYRLTGIRVSRRVFIGEGVYFIDGFQSGLVELEADAVLPPKAIVIAMAFPGASFLQREYNVARTGAVRMGEGAWIGAGAIILPPSQTDPCTQTMAWSPTAMTRQRLARSTAAL